MKEDMWAEKTNILPETHDRNINLINSQGQEHKWLEPSHDNWLSDVAMNWFPGVVYQPPSHPISLPSLSRCVSSHEPILDQSFEGPFLEKHQWVPGESFPSSNECASRQGSQQKTVSLLKKTKKRQVARWLLLLTWAKYSLTDHSRKRRPTTDTTKQTEGDDEREVCNFYSYSVKFFASWRAFQSFVDFLLFPNNITFIEKVNIQLRKSRAHSEWPHYCF